MYFFFIRIIHCLIHTAIVIQNDGEDQSLNVLSYEQVEIHWPFGDMSHPMSLESWPFKVAKGSQVFEAQILAVQS